MIYYVLTALAAALVTFLVTHALDKPAKIRESARADAAERMLAQAKEDHQTALKNLKEANDRALDSTRQQLALENEKALKQREESLKKQAEETMRNITGSLDKDIAAMKEAFEAQKKAHLEEASSMKTKFEETLNGIRRQTETIGGKADRLADALRHDNKLQGNWGERMLKNIFDQEGLVEGRDYDREGWLRDESGNIISNEDTGNRMRPDYILHFPDSTDVIVDSKLNIDAYIDWYNANTDEEKEKAARRNLDAIKAQIKGLSTKRYADNVKGRKSLNFVIMYVSNYGALQLARQLEPNIVNEAFRQNVLITTEETLMPFLRIIHTAWVNVDQIKNQEKIVKAAQTMVERVADFCEANASVGKKLQEALEFHQKGTKKLEEGGQSIVHAANEVVRLGVGISPKKQLPEAK